MYVFDGSSTPPTVPCKIMKVLIFERLLINRPAAEEN